MTQSWKISALASRGDVEAALIAHEDALEWDPDIVLSGSEVAPERPGDRPGERPPERSGERPPERPGEWLLEAWLSRKPGKADKAAVAALFPGKPPRLTVENIPETDWVTLSQRGIAPIRAGRFHVRTPDHAALHAPGVVDFMIPASQAFGTGHHETTAGCLAMLDAMKARGVIARNVADIGTGTGLLAFAALALWPRALATASDIDPVCVGVVVGNAAANAVPMGAGAGQLVMAVADGMADPLLEARGPYDLLIANILAGPLVDLAPDFAPAVVPGGHVLLSGLLETQEPAVRAAYRKAGLRLAARMVRGDWSVLWLRKRAGVRVRASRFRSPSCSA